MTGTIFLFPGKGFYVNTYGIILSFLSGTVFLNDSLSTSRTLVLFWGYFCFKRTLFNSLKRCINLTLYDRMTLNLHDKKKWYVYFCNVDGMK